MFKNYLTDSALYINFLYYGFDLISGFDSLYDTLSVKPLIYKNKYERLSKEYTSYNDTLYNRTTALVLFRLLYNTLKSNDFKYINFDKLEYIKKLLSENDFGRLLYNNILSISFIELDIDDDLKWKEIKDKCLSMIHSFSKFIHDDSHENYRILSLDIQFISYDSIVSDNKSEIKPQIIKSYIPDITSYNSDIVNSYLDIIDTDFDLLNILDSSDSIKKQFTSELKYFINTGKITEDGIYSDFFKKYCKKSLLDDINILKIFYRELLSLLSEDNLDYFISLQFNLFKLIYKDAKIKNEKSSIYKFLLMFISLDIFIYNKARLYNDYELYLSLFKQYNFYIIKLKDILDSSKKSNSINRKTFIQLYKNQLLKSRDKIKYIIDNFKKEE